MGEYERALEIAGTGIGVVFLALVSLTLVTMVLTRYLKEGRPHSETAPSGSSEAEPAPVEPAAAQGEDDPAVVAAMVAAIQVIRGGAARIAMGALPSSVAPTVGAWRSQGRQSLMQSQGSPTNTRSRKR